MLHSLVIREITLRLQHGMRNGGPLQALKLKKAGTLSVEGENDLPQVTLLDMQVQSKGGSSASTINCWLRTSRKYDWVRMEDDDKMGLIDWMEAIMDAIETKPSDGLPDNLLVAHTSDFKIRPDRNGQEYALLTEGFVWNTSMTEINNLNFTLQMDLSYKQPDTQRGRRRVSPFQQ